MARTSTKNVAQPVSDSAPTESAPVSKFAVKASSKAAIVHLRGPKENPLEQAVADSVHGAQFVPCKTEEDLKEATNLLRRGARDRKLSLKIQAGYEGDDYGLHFQASTQVRERKYTNADVRAWALPEHGEIVGRIPKSIRDAFKQAHGYKVDANNTTD